MKFLAAFFLLLSFESSANDRDSVQRSVHIKTFDPKALKQTIGNTNYQEKKPKPAKAFNPPSFQVPWSEQVSKIIAYALVGAIISVVIYLVLKNTSFKRKIKPANEVMDASGNVDDIHEFQYRELLLQAIDADNFRLAIRIYFLELLKLLDEQKQIAWSKEKTNRDYLNELFRKRYLFDDISQLTSIYERTWYGEHVPTKESFDILKVGFENTFQHIGSPAKP